MDLSTIFLLIVIAIIALWAISIFNKITGCFNRAKRAWGDVIAYERLKNDTLPQLVKLTEQYQEFETGLMSQVTKLRTAIQSLSDENIETEKLAVVEKLSKSVTESIQLSVENYPDLKSNQVVQQLMSEISQKNSNVTAAITLFNRAVEEFNNAIQYFPNSFINGAFVKKSALQTFSDSNASKGFEFEPNFD